MALCSLMGLETVIALMAILIRRGPGAIESVLLVGPIRVIEGVWRQEPRRDGYAAQAGGSARCTATPPSDWQR